MSMNKKVLIANAILACSLLTCCSSDDDGFSDSDSQHQVVNMLSTPKYVQLTYEQKQFATDNNGFTLNFLKTVNEADRSGKSFIYSPLSITYVLGMVNDAAVGQTEQELEQTLGFHQGGIQSVNEYCKTLIDKLPKVDESVSLNIANAIFVNKNNATLKEQYQQEIQQYYDAKAEALDFKSPSTLDHINSWCNDKTQGMIPTILNQVSPDVVSYLLNAIYFKADWSSKFDPKNTKKEAFSTEIGTTQIPLMHQTVLINYLKNDTFSAVNIPYGNGMWVMSVMLPEKGKTIDDIVNSLSETGWSADYNNPMFTSTPHEVDLKMPRFETTSDTDDLEGSLINIMKKMGIHLVFDAQLAQIPNMCKDKNLFISMMRQKAAIKVDEEGSEAAAVTVVGMETSAYVGPMEYPKATFHANRPFVYVIREASSGVILFVGKYTGK